MYLFWNCKQPQDSAELFRWAPRASPYRVPPLAATATQLLLTLSPPAGSERTTGAVGAQGSKTRRVSKHLQEQTECCLQILLRRLSHADTAMRRRCLRHVVLQGAGLPPEQSRGRSDGQQGRFLPDPGASTHLYGGTCKGTKAGNSAGTSRLPPPQAVSLAIRLRAERAPRLPSPRRSLTAVLHPNRW